ncbi:plasmid replication protein, CyRepA1 family, partial [Kamptonema formosum]|uniref:plasmid replication protein, CyRepA1 family n=1 Tax=Kamptonema formosum TaxID=331992 RepID=UPI000360620A
PDLLPFDDGRDVTICFDYRPGDYFKSPEWVNAAILGKLFKQSTVKIARLPGPQKGIDDFAVAGGDVAQVLAAAESLKQLQDERLWRFCYKGFSPEKKVNQRYLDIEAPEPGKIIAPKSGLATGKTQLLADKVATQPGKQINIGYRNSLLLQQAQKIGSYHLDEHDGRRFFEDPNARISLCWDSLLKLPPEIFEGAHIILDEASSSIKHLLTSSTCKEKRLEILDYLEKIGPTVGGVIALDGNLKDSDIQYLEEIFKMPSVKIENEFKGDTPPVTFLELPKGRYRIAKAEFEWLARAIMDADCPAIATDSLNDAEALYKKLTAQGKKGILLSSKTATKKWAKEFLANPDEYIRKHKPEFIIFTPTAESGLDISIKEKIDNLEIGNYFSDVFCIFRGVIGVDECLQMSRRVRHPERIVICCAERKFASNNDSNPFSGQLIKDIEERVTAEMKALSPEENTAAIKEAIKAQIDSPHLEAWAKIKGKDAVEARNLRRFLLKSFEDGGYEVNRISFSDLLNPDAIYDEGMSFADAKKLSKEEEAKQIFNSEFITLEKYLEIEGSNAEWEDCCKAIKYRLLARLPGIENTELWTWEFVYRIRFTDRDLLNQLYANWKLENPIDAELLQRQNGTVSLELSCLT